MKVKGKAKQLFCMACAFVASFMVTVTAFASTYGTVNSKWFGTYKCSTPYLSGSKIIARNYYDCDIIAYYDSRDEHKTYYSGHAEDYILSPEMSTQFWAVFTKANKVNSYGVPIKENGVIVTEPNYEASGKILNLSPKTIYSYESGLNYVLQG